MITHRLVRWAAFVTISIAAFLFSASADAAPVAAKRAILGPPTWVQRPSPAVDCQLTANRCWNGFRVVAPSSLLTTTRASTGYATTSAGLLVNFAANAPRITDLGLLIEESRINYLTWSNTFSDGFWQNGAPTGLTANATTDPAGGNAGWQWTGGGRIWAQTTAAGNATYAASIYIKSSGSSQNVTLVVKDNASDTVRGTSGAVATTGSWQRITASGTTAGGTTGFRWEVTTTGTFFLAFAGMEPGSFATSYNPTTSGTVTRAADNIIGAGRLLASYQGSAVSFFAQVNGETQNTANPRVIGSTVSPNSPIFHGGAPGGVAGTFNGTTALGTANNIVVGGLNKFAVGLNAAGRSIVMNNGTVATDANSPGNTNGIQLGSDAAGNQFMDGYLQRLAAWNSRLPDSMLKGRTVP